MKHDLDRLAVDLQAAIETYQDAAILLTTALAVIEGHELGATTLPTSELRQALARLIQVAVREAECGRDLVQAWGNRLDEPTPERPGWPCPVAILCPQRTNECA
jgi:hypothetical protein